MKPSQNRLRETSRQRSEAIVERHVHAVTDVAVYTWPGYTAGENLYEDLIQALADLAEERPDTVELLRGRTFARAIH